MNPGDSSILIVGSIISYHRLTGIFAIFILLFILNGFQQPSIVKAEPSGILVHKWTRGLPADPCNSGSDTNCHFGSPVLADLNGDGFKDVVAVTNKGHIIAIKHNGSLLWDTDIAPIFGMGSGTHEIHSSPAIADIDNDGQVEIAVGTGTTRGNVCTQGGLIVLNHNGGLEPGWPFLASDGNIPPAGCRDSIFSSPALGDLDNDGDLEIVAAGFDKRIYAWHHNGQLLAGYPPNSYLLDRFPDWDNLIGRLADDTWASPALADLNRDGFLDIIITTGEGNFDSRWGGDAKGWTCPYAGPPGWAPGYCGGSLYVLDRFGKLLPGFPRYFLEGMFSSPAIADVNNDGWHEIFMGTSDFYYSKSPDHPTYGFRLFGLDHNGQDLPGWSGGKVVGGSTPASPAIGDITGDSQPEIVIAAMDKKLYAFHIDGTPVSGFPMTPKDFLGKTLAGYGTGTSFILADYDGDGKMEIIFNQAWSVSVVDGNGQILTATNYPSDPRPIYLTNGTLLNTPAVGDIDNDGKLEMVVTNSVAYAWDLPGPADKVDWGMFKLNPSRTAARTGPPIMKIQADQLLAMHQAGAGENAKVSLSIKNIGDEPFNFSITPPSGVSVSQSGGTLHRNQEAVISILIPTNGKSIGFHDLGHLLVDAWSNNNPVIDNHKSLPLRLFLGQVNQGYLPVTYNSDC